MKLKYVNLKSTVFRQLLLCALVTLVFGLPALSGRAHAAETLEREYLIKAGFMHKFLLFADWPAADGPAVPKTVTIGILGDSPFGRAFGPVEGEPVLGRKLVIRLFKKGTAAAELKKCDLLFIAASLNKDVGKIINSLGTAPVLTVSEVKGFCARGGMINFILKGDMVRFEINQRAAERIGIKLRSKLLRVAERIVEDKIEEKDGEKKL